VDLSEAFVEASRYLTKRTGQEDKVTFQQGNALDLPFSDGRFDASLLLHVAMNIGDRARLYHEIRRVLRRGGKLAVFDVVQNGGEPHYPVPWARTPETSYLLTAEETRKAIEGAQFQTVGCRDDTDAVKAWSRQLSTSGPPPAPNLGLVMGPDFPVLAANLGRNFLEDRLGVLTAIFQAV
jgi:ubiquinone/menaquinone biosynthesis C-methylase UbiE